MSEIITTETQELVNGFSKELEQVDSFKITCPAEYTIAGELLKQVKGRYNEVERIRKDLESPQREALKRLQGFFKPVLDKFSAAETKLKRSIADWNIEQARIQAEQERIAREKAAQEQDRIDREVQAQALIAEQNGNHNQAEEIIAMTPRVSMPVIEKEQVKVAGISMRDNWGYRIKDANKIPREYMIPNEKLLTQLAKTTKGALSVPGVEFFNDPIVASRAM